MVNLRAAANRLTTTINPNTTAVLRASTGYTTGPSGKQVPSYADGQPVRIQAQAMTTRDLRHISALGVQGIERAVYANVQLAGVDRASGRGGDLVELDGATWLVTIVLEDWSPTSGWCKVGLTKQRTATV